MRFVVIRLRRWFWWMVAVLFFFGAGYGGVQAWQWYWRWMYPFPYRELILEHAARQDLDPFLVAAVIRVESRFRPHATSQKGARGLMQVMPATGGWAAEQMGIENFTPDRLYEPDMNIRIGTWYLSHLREEFRGEEVLALAAYNAGRGQVRRWLEAQQEKKVVPDIADFPYRETREYVGKVLRVHRRYQRLYSEVYGRAGLVGAALVFSSSGPTEGGNGR